MSALRPIVVTRLGVRSKQGAAPAPAWLEERLALLRTITWPSLCRQEPGVAWVLLVDEELREQAAEALRDVTLPDGHVHLATAVGFVPTTSEIRLDERVHADVPEGAGPFLTFRLDSDDALLPGAIARARRAAEGASDGCLVDLPHGYQLDLATGRVVETFAGPDRQGPFLALVHRSRATMLDTGGQHMHARAGRELRRVDDVAWVQVLHGGNVANTLAARTRRQRLARAGRALRHGTRPACAAWQDGRPLPPARAAAVRARAAITAEPQR